MSGQQGGGIAFKLNGGLEAMQQQQLNSGNQEEFLQVLHTHQNQVGYTNGQRGLQLALPQDQSSAVATGIVVTGEERIPMIPLSSGSVPVALGDSQSTTNSQAGVCMLAWVLIETLDHPNLSFLRSHITEYLKIIKMQLFVLPVIKFVPFLILSIT